MPKNIARKGAKPRGAGDKKASGAAKKRVAGKTQKPAARKPKHQPEKKKEQKRYETEGVYEETVITCPGCGRETKVIKLSGISTEAMLCQRCAKGEVEIEDMDF